MNADNIDVNSLSENVLGAVFEVSITLGAGFLEKVYQRALLRELTLRGIRPPPKLLYFADLLVEDVRSGGGVEMCRAPRQGAHGAMSELSIYEPPA
jgi:hypothetical protein